MQYILELTKSLADIFGGEDIFCAVILYTCYTYLRRILFMTPLRALITIGIPIIFCLQKNTSYDPKLAIPLACLALAAVLTLYRMFYDIFYLLNPLNLLMRGRSSLLLLGLLALAFSNGGFGDLDKLSSFFKGNNALLVAIGLPLAMSMLNRARSFIPLATMGGLAAMLFLGGSNNNLTSGLNNPVKSITDQVGNTNYTSFFVNSAKKIDEYIKI